MNVTKWRMSLVVALLIAFGVSGGAAHGDDKTDERLDALEKRMESLEKKIDQLVSRSATAKKNKGRLEEFPIFPRSVRIRVI